MVWHDATKQHLEGRCNRLYWVKGRVMQETSKVGAGDLKLILETLRGGSCNIKKGQGWKVEPPA